MLQSLFARADEKYWPILQLSHFFLIYSRANKNSHIKIAGVNAALEKCTSIIEVWTTLKWALRRGEGVLRRVLVMKPQWIRFFTSPKNFCFRFHRLFIMFFNVKFS